MKLGCGVAGWGGSNGGAEELADQPGVSEDGNGEKLLGGSEEAQSADSVSKESESISSSGEVGVRSVSKTDGGGQEAEKEEDENCALVLCSHSEEYI